MHCTHADGLTVLTYFNPFYPQFQNGDSD